MFFFGLLAAILLTDSARGNPPLPVIPPNVYYVTNYGALGDGLTNNAGAIQSAINTAAGAGGGTVEITAASSNYMCGPLTLKSSINLQVDAGATLQMLPIASWPGSTTFINGSGINNVEISGFGTIDGNAQFGSGQWWAPASSRPNFINFSTSKIILIQNVRLHNPPTFHLMLKGNDGNITIQNINIDTDPNSPNTDGMDLGSTNILVQNCHITDGDDNIEIGGSSATVADLMVTNCMFGHGHGVSVGSLVQAGVSNVTVINCIFTNSDNAIRLKSDNDRGGIVQNMAYYNLGMTNIKYAPILIYSYYNAHGNPTTSGITPAVAQGTAVASVSSKTPIWRNIIISNITATAGQPGMIWARTELPAANIVLSKLNITSTDSSAGDSAFALYNVRGVQIVDSQIHPAGSKTFELFNAQAIFTNTATGASTIALDGVAVTNALAFYNQPASFTDGTMFGATSISLGGSLLADATSLTLAAASPVNFILGTNLAKVSVTGNLTLSSTLNIAAGAGFAAGTYTLFSYSSRLSGSPVLGATPAGFNYVLTTTNAGQVNLLVTATNGSTVAPSISTQPTNQAVIVGQSTNLSVVASGTAPLSYQWYFNTNSPLANATNSTFTITNAQSTDAGGYSVIVTNSAGSVTSAVATLTVNLIAPFISTQPTNQSVLVGDNTSFAVQAGGTGPLSYQWYFNTNSPLANATNLTLTLANVQTNNAGGYSVIVTNSAGSVTSLVATLTVNLVSGSIPPFNITSIRILTPDSVGLTWDAVSNHVYQVLSQDTLDQLGWDVLGSVTASLDSASFTNSGLSTVPQRFYRVIYTQ